MPYIILFMPIVEAEAELFADDPLEALGREIRQLRRARELTLADLADSSGLSLSFLSKIERGVSKPSLTSLQDIAEALDVQVGWFFNNVDAAPTEEQPFVVRSHRRRRLTYSGMAGTDYLGFEDHLLSASLDRQLALGQSRYAPGGSTGDDLQVHEGEEAGLIIEGTIELTVDGATFVLDAGDSFSFPGDLPHRYENTSAHDAVLVWANSPLSLRRK